MYAEVLLDKPTRNFNQPLHYSIPAELSSALKIGQQVLVPFGRRVTLGYVVGFSPTSPVISTKPINKITWAEPLFSDKQIALARWLADYYDSFFITALKLQLPPGGVQDIARAGQPIKRKSKTKDALADFVSAEQVAWLTLNREQAAALEPIESALKTANHKAFLLHGVTGSGKTEIYLRATQTVLSLGKTAIIMVPEIGLTSQLVTRFCQHFPDQIALLHSDLTAKQRGHQWQRIALGQAKIVLGTRSAIFAPLKDLGLIVVDEEYEQTYKSEKSPRYHVREVAAKLAGLNNAVVVLGSATPSIETYYDAEHGKYERLNLPNRIDSRPLPPVTIVDMRHEKERVLSPLLREELKATFERHEQAILFINRRGFFTFIMCRDCGQTLECERCGVPLVYYQGEKLLRCNHCGQGVPAPSSCPRCNAVAINYFGLGTQRIEQEVAEIWPDVRILRYDRDSVAKRGDHTAMLDAFAAGKADVLIGTQMVTKGMDVANVTLVGVVAADTALNLPEFRAAERTFQLLTQVAGRAGRHHLPGKVIIQTYNPNHYAIQTAAKHDYEAFYRQEIKHREELDYPPFTHLINIILTGAVSSQVANTANSLAQFLNKRLAVGQVLGPVPATFAKLRGSYRYQIMLKGREIAAIRQALNESLTKLVLPVMVKVTVDVDPISLL
jgi:primosomal protein N' (replication factor Y)